MQGRASGPCRRAVKVALRSVRVLLEVGGFVNEDIGPGQIAVQPGEAVSPETTRAVEGPSMRHPHDGTEWRETRGQPVLGPPCRRPAAVDSTVRSAVTSIHRPEATWPRRQTMG